jgi:putative membrane protein
MLAPVQREALMVRFIVQWLVTALGLWLSSVLIAGVEFSSTTVLILAALVLGLINAVIRPILVIITFPITVITLGLFLLVVNAAMIGLASAFFDGFTVSGFWPAIGAAVVTGVVSWIAGAFIRD